MPLLRGAPRPEGNRELGAAAIEAAILVSLVLLPLVFGAIELGRVLWIRSQLVNAAREGGYFAQSHPEMVQQVGTQCLPPNSVDARARSALRKDNVLLAVQANSISVSVRRLDTNATITGCNEGLPTIPSGTRVAVRVSGTVIPHTVLGILPVGGFTLSGIQEVRVL
jgi:hypothetical protein